MPTSVDPDVLESALARIERASRRRGPRIATIAASPLPVHTLVTPAEGYQHDLASRAGRIALKRVHAFAPDCVVLWRALRLPGWKALPTDPARVDDLLARLDGREPGLADQWPEAVLAHQVYRRVTRRLEHQPLQDLRIDFSGLIGEPMHEVDRVSVQLAEALNVDLTNSTAPPRVGLMIGSLQPGAAGRSLRILDTVLTTLAALSGAILPEPFAVSASGIASADVVSALVQVMGTIEQRTGIRKGALRLELMLDRAGGILDDDGRIRIKELLIAARGRCDVVRIDTEALTVAHGSGVAALVRDLVRLSIASTPVQLSAGASPPLPHLANTEVISPSQRAERFAEVHTAWRDHATDVSEQVRSGTPWGWDLDPGQLPPRLAATLAFGRSHWTDAMSALASTLSRALTDEAVGPELLADGQAQLETLLRWLDCGAVDVAEVASSGLDAQDLASRSFQVLIDRRSRS